MATVRVIEPSSPEEKYFRQLLSSANYIKLKCGIYALPDHSESGTTMKNIYVILRSYPFYITCSCSQVDCLHSAFLVEHLPDWVNEFDNPTDETPWWEVTPNLFGVYCKDDGSIGLVKKTINGGIISCLVCNKTKCRHVNIYKSNNTVSQFKEENFKCLSSEKNPLSNAQGRKFQVFPAVSKSSCS